MLRLSRRSFTLVTKAFADSGYASEKPAMAMIVDVETVCKLKDQVGFAVHPRPGSSKVLRPDQPQPTPLEGTGGDAGIGNGLPLRGLGHDPGNAGGSVSISEQTLEKLNDTSAPRGLGRTSAGYILGSHLYQIAPTFAPMGMF